MKNEIVTTEKLRAVSKSLAKNGDKQVPRDIEIETVVESTDFLKNVKTEEGLKCENKET